MQKYQSRIFGASTQGFLDLWFMWEVIANNNNNNHQQSLQQKSRNYSWIFGLRSTVTLQRNCTHPIYWLFRRLRILTAARQVNFALELFTKQCKVSAWWRYRRTSPIPGKPQSNPELTKLFRAYNGRNTGHRLKKVTQIITAPCTPWQKPNKESEKMFQLAKVLVMLSACCEACLAALKIVGRGNTQQNRKRQQTCTHSRDFGQCCCCAPSAAPGEHRHCNF